MKTSRRDFMKSFGIALVSLAMTRCSILSSSTDTAKDQLRNCWLRLDWLAQQVREAALVSGQESQARNSLIDEHQTALDTMVASGELDASVAREMQRAFEEATIHVKNINTVVVMCYEVADPNFLDTRPEDNSLETVRADLIRRAEALQEINLDLNPAAVQRAEQAIARDITFLKLVLHSSAKEGLFSQYQSYDMDINPKALEAAQLLVDIILGD